MVKTVIKTLSVRVRDKHCVAWSGRWWSLRAFWSGIWRMS